MRNNKRMTTVTSVKLADNTHILLLSSVYNKDIWNAYVSMMNRSGKYADLYPEAMEENMDKILHVSDEFGSTSYTLALHVTTTERIELPISSFLLISNRYIDTSYVIPKPTDIHEIYSLSRHTDIRTKGKGLVMLNIVKEAIITSSLLLFEDGPQKRIHLVSTEQIQPFQSEQRYKDAQKSSKEAIIWLGATKMELVRKVYQPANFYFPSILNDVHILENTSPTGRRIGGEITTFYSGYYSKYIVTFLHSYLAIPVQTIFPKKEYEKICGKAGTDDYGMLGTVDGETAGFFVTNSCNIISLSEEGLSQQRNARNPSNKCVVVPDAPTESINRSISHIYPFHTHPLSCYHRLGSMVAPPSVGDYTYIFHNTIRDKADAYFIIAREGIFVIQLHPFLKYLLKTNHIVLEYLLQALGELTSYLHSNHYEESCGGIDETSSAICSKMRSGATITQEDTKYIFSFDSPILEKYLSVIHRPYLRYKKYIKIPLLYAQVITRDQFREEKRDPSFIVPFETMRSESTYVHPVNTDPMNVDDL